ncbi:hypothetical protein [Candidatus Ichthyocystis sparus]|uniref:hypothetical protein n=1 Tax=Candidatus Ichthyocystis sparus TaxID=1561004 RepID=UPI000A4403E1|nr:hypothetical protein [Candidatus Ichthyocystis sparus]
MCPVSATGAAAFSDALEDGGGEDNVNNKEGGIQLGISGSDLQQIEVSAALATTTSNAAIAPNIATSVGKVMSATGVKGKAPAREFVAASSFTAGSSIFDSLGVKLHPDSAQIINDLLFKVDALAKRTYKSVISKQLPLSVSDKLTATGRTVWYSAYRVLCDVNFVHSCLCEYHAKHRPGFIRSLPVIKVLSNSSGSDMETLSGGGLLSFLSKLDSAVRGTVESVFNSHWDEAVDKVFSVLEEGGVCAVSCKDFTDVLNIAGIPSMALSSLSYLTTQSSETHTSSKDVDKCTSLESGSSSSPIVEERHTSSSRVSIPVFTRAEAGIVCPVAEEAPSIQYVGLLGVKLHTDSAELIGKLFSDLRESAELSYSNSISNCLLMSVDSELSVVGRAVWFSTYRELHLYSFVSKCICIYHYKYRPNFMRALPSIRVLSSSSDHKLVSLSGGSLLDFLSKLDCAIRKELESIFNLEWDREVFKVFSKLEDIPLSNVRCGDFIDVLDVAGIPVVAFSASKRQLAVGKRKILGNSSKVTSEGTTSGSGTVNLARSSSSLQLQSELSSQPEPESLPEGTVFSLPLIAESVAVSTADDIVPDLEVLGDELSEPSFSTLLVSESLSTPSFELEQLPIFASFLHHNWLDNFSDTPDNVDNKDVVIQGDVSVDDLQLLEAPILTTDSATTSTTVTITTGKGVTTRSKGKASARKLDTSIAVSSSVAIVDSDVLSSLGVVLSPDSVRVIEGLFLKVYVFSKRTYKNMVIKQFPSGVSDKLTVTGRAIWYFTYRMMCEDNFVSRCLGEYHYEYRPGFIRALPSIRVLSNSPDCGVVPLNGDSLLDFLSRLDCAVRNRVKSIFDSCWSEVSVTLEEESLNTLSCKDFIKVLEVADIPPLALSAMLEATAYARSKFRTKGKNRAISEGTGNCTASGTSVTDIAYSSPSSSQLLPSQSHTELLDHMHYQSESQLDTLLPLGEASGTPPSRLTPLSFVGDSGGGSFSDQIVAKRYKDSDSVTVSTYAETEVVSSIVGILPISSESNIITSAAISPPSSCVSLSVQCVDLLGVKLHPDSAELIYSIFREVRISARRSFSQSMINYISTIASSELSARGKVIWFKTYKELHLSRFMCKFICVYHYKYRPNFIRSLDSIRVLSSSSDPMLVPLSGVGLLDFLSKLDCDIREEVRSIFNLEWDRVADKVFAELEDRSLGDVSCEDFINVLDIAGIPIVAFSAFQRKRTMGKRKISGNSSKVTSDGTASGSGNIGLVSSSSNLQLQSELSSQPETDSLSEGTGSYLPLVDESVAASNVYGESFLITSDAVLVSTADDVVSDLEVLEDELFAPSFSPVLLPESLSSPAFELEQLPMFTPFLHHHWLDKLD